jgi:hypothetical protein
MLDVKIPAAPAADRAEAPAASAETSGCEHCQSDAKSLFSISFLDRHRQLVALRVCRFCYLRLAGVQPRRGDLTRTRILK